MEHLHGISARKQITSKFVMVASRKDAGFLPGRKVILVEHGAGQHYDRDPGQGGATSGNRDIVLFLAPSQRVADNGKDIYPVAKRVAVGSPRVEYLASLLRTPHYVVTAWHWNMPGVSEGKGAWDRYNGAVVDLARRFPVLGHGHPRMKSRLGREYRNLKIEQEWSWEKCVQVAAALVVDNSSVMWEACALDIPVVVVNAHFYRREVDWGLRFWEYADVGPQVNSPAELAGAVQRVLEDGDEWTVRRRQAAEYVYARIEGSAAAAADEIMQILG